MYSLDEILRMSVEEKASDIHFTAGCPPYYRIDGVLTPLKGDKLTANRSGSIAAADFGQSS